MGFIGDGVHVVVWGLGQASIGWPVVDEGASVPATLVYRPLIHASPPLLVLRDMQASVC